MNLQEMVIRPMDWNEFFKMAISSLPTTLSFGKWNLGLNRGATGIGLNLIFKLNM